MGPVTVAVPLRDMPGRTLPVISSEDSRAAERLTGLLADLAFQVNSYRIPPNGLWQPQGDVVAICGPKNSQVTAEALTTDPNLSFEPNSEGRWVITDRDTRQEFTSPMDEADGDVWIDVAYIGRLGYRGSPLLIIAGVHALGSVGAVDYLSKHLPDLYASVGTSPFSAVIRSSHDGETVLRSELACPPRVHE